MSQTQTRATFVLGDGASSSSSGGSSNGGGARVAAAAPSVAPSTATASFASLSPVELVGSWRVPSLLELCAQAMAKELLSISERDSDALPAELTELVFAAASAGRAWSAEKLAHVKPLLPTLEELSIAQCDALTGPQLETVCSALTRPLLRVDLSRSYHLSELAGLLRAAGGLASLRVLDLDRCRRVTSAELLPVLRAAPALQELRLSGTRVDASTLRALASTPEHPSPVCSGLRHLDVSACLLQDGLGALCTSALPLEILVLHGTNFPLDQLMELRRLASSLRSLNVQFMPKLRDAALESIGACTHLTSLDLSRNTHVSDEGFALLRNLTDLTSLHLSHVDLTPLSAPVLTRFRRLEHIDLSYNGEVSDSMLLTLCAALRRLRVLLLTYCASLTDAAVTDAIIPHLQRLQVLKLNGCARMGDGAMLALAEKAREAPVLLPRDDEQEDGVPVPSPSPDLAASPPPGAAPSSASPAPCPASQPAASPAPSESPNPSAADNDSLSQAARPRWSFPHCLLALECGWGKMTDASVPALASLLPSLRHLQRVAIWNSSISSVGMKTSVAKWHVEPVAPFTPAASPSASSTLATWPSPSKQQHSHHQSTMHPSSIPPPPSAWLLDESMKTAPGTFILVRRATLSAQHTTSFQSPPPSTSVEGVAEVYGLSDHLARLKSNHAKAVSWAADESLATFFDPLPACAGEDEEGEDEPAASSAHTSDEEDEEEQSSVVRFDDEDGSESASAESSVVRAEASSGDEDDGSRSASAGANLAELFKQLRANAR